MPAAVRFVLLRPRIAENLGAVARALKNFGFRDWVVVDPQTDDWPAARRLAVQSEDVLEGMRREPSLEAAIADCVWVVGTSSRQRRGRRRLAAREAGQLAWERSTEGPVAIVFGDERSGLTNEELDRCHDSSVVFTSPDQPSINLAQAVLLYAYEIRTAAEGAAPPRSASIAKPATDAQSTGVKQALAEALTRGGFLRDDGRDALRDLSTIFDRARLTRDEAALWTAALRSITKRLGGG